LREAYENHDWRWEAERRHSVHQQIEACETRGRNSLVAVDAMLANQIEGLRLAGLPDTIQITTGVLTIRCAGMEDLMRQLVVLAKITDVDFEGIRALVEGPVLRSPTMETRAADRTLGQSS